jgi:ADP-ribosylglycohydrolase
MNSKNILYGVSVGDALGVPVEFKSRQTIALNPVTDMIGYGTYNLPPGSFSDDSSLTFCLAEALIQSFSLQTIANNFVKWLKEGYWTPYGRVFDIGIATQEAINNLAKGVKPENAGSTSETSNGNGSLMRILPLILYTIDKPIKERYEITKQVSSITHGHIRSIIACFYYLEFARYIIKGESKTEIYNRLQKELPAFLKSVNIDINEIEIFDRLFRGNISFDPEHKIKSSGYVLHSLEASIWCLLTTNNYKDAVLKAVNLGEDTDTTAAITGGLAGLLYGYENIPQAWINKMARKYDIDDLANRLNETFKL